MNLVSEPSQHLRCRGGGENIGDDPERESSRGATCVASGRQVNTIYSMSGHADFATYCTELLAPAGKVRCKRMFGGYGLYVDDVFVAIVVGDALYLKTDEQSLPRFQVAGGRRFEYMRQGKQQGLAFWTVPAEAMDSPVLMQPWVRLALDAALRARAGHPPSRRPT